MNNFTKRLLFGIIYVAIVFIAIWYNPNIYIAIFNIFMFLSIYEFQKMHQTKSIFPFLIGICLSGIFYIINLHFFNTKIDVKYVIALFFLLLFAPFIQALFRDKKNTLDILKLDFLTFVYLVIPFSLMQLIPFLTGKNKYNNQIMLGVFILIWINDTFAYLVGRQFGKHKLFERISPKKTIEGFIGGLLFSFIGGFILSHYFTTLSLLQWITIASISSIFGTIGDLIESMFKRNAKIKDSSNLIPGHGGFLDRLDSVIFATPFIFIYLILFT